MKPYVVLVAIDFSTASAAAMEQALELASRNAPAEVHAVTVQELSLELLAPPNERIESPIAPLRDLAKDAATKFAASHPASRIERVVIHALFGSPVGEIVALAAELDADAIVVGTHGRRGVRRALLGSVAERVVRTAGCPVLVVRPKNHPDALKVPEIEPPCPACVEARRASDGAQPWCERHSEHHVHAHVYGYESRGEGGARPWGFTT
ncbi:MAG TPA: universal stress protein [Minicystis sp.]|nr:universal stress protein [Minicystis sp.]